MKREEDKESDWPVPEEHKEAEEYKDRQGVQDRSCPRTLKDYREEIDRIDGQILSMLSSRQKIAMTIGQIKREHGIEVTDSAREQTLLQHLIEKNPPNLTKDAIRNIYTEIISAARAVQEPLVVAFLGPEATFTHQAAVSLFGHEPTFREAKNIEEVFRSVENGLCHQGVVPVENSYEGCVNNTLDLLYKYNLKINAEIFFRIRHHLLSRSDHIQEVKQLYSHPMALAQCRSWIMDHLHETRIRETDSTALAAKMASREPESAAIGSRLAALHYGLNLLAENIEDHPDNITRFLAIASDDAPPTTKDKTSLLFALKHKPGALYHALEPLARNKINITQIESRPMKTRSWEYLFYLDLEGHRQDPNVLEAIEEMESHCLFVKWLGSYPAGGGPWE